MARCRKADVRRVRLGRYPFAAGIKYYVARRMFILSTSTMAENEKKLRRMAYEFESLKSAGAVSTTDPRHMDRADIEAYLILLKKRGLKPSTRERNVQILKGYLELFGNRIISDMKAQDGRITPMVPNEPIRALTIEELQRIFDAAEKVEGHRGQIIRGIFALAFATGVRPKEFVRAELKDLDLVKKRFFVRHPKGEESWGPTQWIPIIRGDMIPRLERYLRDRDELVRQCGNSKYLFFNPKTGDPYSLKTVRQIKAQVEDISGVQFYLKDFRSTLATVTIEGDLSRLKPVSMQLRHSHVSTTERFYARIQDGEIERAIGDVWKDNPIR